MSDHRTWDEAHRRRREELEAIKAALTDRIEDLAPILLPDGARVGHEWRDGRRGSKSIKLRGPAKGTYRDFEAGTRPTGPLDAIAELVCAGSIREAISWSRSFLGMEDVAAEAIARAARRAEERRQRSAADAERERERRAGLARQLWHGAAPIAGTPAESYLRDRGIDLSELRRIPGVLRYTERAWCAERQAEHPAMLASLWRTGWPQPVATHRTYLEHRDVGWRKARIASPRSTLGSWPGAIIPIQRGDGDRRWRDLEEGELVAFGEGIEEALSIALIKPEWRVAAVGYVANFAQIVLPCWCHVMLCTNNDPDDSEAAAAIYGGQLTDGSHRIGAVEALEAKGHVVRVARPDARFKDWNDELTGKELEHG